MSADRRGSPLELSIDISRCQQDSALADGDAFVVAREISGGRTAVRRVERDAIFASQIEWLSAIGGDGAQSLIARLGNYPIQTADFAGTDQQQLDKALTAVSGGRVLLLEPRTYTLTSRLEKALSNCAIIGVPGLTKITTSTYTQVLRLLSCSDVLFSGITFETTRVSAGADTGTGVVYSNPTGFGSGHTLERVSFSRCRFTAPSNNTNALKLVLSSSAIPSNEWSTVSDILIEDCQFEDIGQMGFEVVNNAAGTTVLYKRVRVLRSLFRNTGLSGSYGMGVSLSGPGTRCVVEDCDFDNNLILALENAGSSQGAFRYNRFKNQPAASASIGMSQGPLYDLQVVGNVDETASTGQTYFFGVNDSYFSGNLFRGGNSTNPSVLFRDGARNTFVGDRYVSTSSAKYALLVESTTGDASDNRWVACRADHSASSSVSDAVVFSGASTLRNRWLNGVIRRGASNLPFSQTNSATDNVMWRAAIANATGDPSTLSDGLKGITVTGSATITERDAQAEIIYLDGTPVSGFTLTFPKVTRRLTIWNATSQTATIACGFGGNATIAAGERALVAMSTDAVYGGVRKVMTTTS